MEYVLLNKDIPLLQFCIERHEDVVNLTTLVRMDISDLTIIDNATLPINMQPTIKGLKNWLLQRKIPNNRAFVENLLDAISDTENPYRYLDVTYGLSLNDTYWVKLIPLFHGQMLIYTTIHLAKLWQASLSQAKIVIYKGL